MISILLVRLVAMLRIACREVTVNIDYSANCRTYLAKCNVQESNTLLLLTPATSKPGDPYVKGLR